MPLPESYALLKPSLVFFTPLHLAPDSPRFPHRLPPILGTGFIVEDGVVVTAGHVVKALSELPVRPGTDVHAPKAAANVFVVREGQGILRFAMPVTALVHPPVSGAEVDFYGTTSPDIGLAGVNYRGLPIAPMAQAQWPLQEGRAVAVAGFPRGTELFVGVNGVDQLAPTLQRGVVAAILPYLSSTATGFMIDVVSYGGGSGSPVFDPDSGEVLGILSAGRDHVVVNAAGEHEHIPQPFTYCAPTVQVRDLIAFQRTNNQLFQLSASAPTLEEGITLELARRAERQRSPGSE